MIGRADIEGSKSDVAMNAWPPQASYPCGNFSDTSCLKLSTIDKRIDRPRFRGPYSYWKSGSSQLLPFYSTRGFCPRWASLRTPALPFDRCTAPVKLPAWHCPRRGSCRANVVLQAMQPYAITSESQPRQSHSTYSPRHLDARRMGPVRAPLSTSPSQ